MIMCAERSKRGSNKKTLEKHFSTFFVFLIAGTINHQTIISTSGAEEELSSSSFSSASRASLDAPSSPTASYSGEHIIPFQGDSSGSL